MWAYAQIMPPKHQTRLVRHRPRFSLFKPAGAPASALEQVSLSLDEYEALRLADYQGLYQEKAANSMGVSRQTFGRIIESARQKVAEALVLGKSLGIEGGPIHFCRSTTVIVAMPLKQNEIEDHFGQCKNIALFKSTGLGDIERHDIMVPDSIGCRSSLAPVLALQGVTHLVAGSMGKGVRAAFEANGVQVITGQGGSVDELIRAVLAGELIDGAGGCDGHDHGDGEAHHHGGGTCCHG